MVMPPPAPGEEAIVEAPEVRSFDDEDASGLEERMDVLANPGGVIHVLEQLKHQDRVEAIPLFGALGEILDSLTMGLETLRPTFRHGPLIEFKADGVPEGIPGLPQKGEEASIPATDIEQLSLARADELAIEPDLPAFPEALSAGDQGIRGSDERVVVGGIDRIEGGGGGARIQIFVVAV